MKKTWKVLAWQFTQLNSAMGDAPSQLKTADTPNGATLRTDKVELLLNPQSLLSYPILKHKENKGSAELMQEMMSPASNDTLEVIETTKVKIPKFQGESNESCCRMVEKWW
ncbi:unnamed protein product [Brassica oleracea var. botrytis]|uniref:Uncharacterized protein n=3 Tax=Brassica TaxID=3705 RepID=A0A0D3BLV0_BRAOL|nr:hypothetical protein F2Q68_00006568 [Brassica cretica]VDD00433.1 unnamed protein product [Brassica oleracea]